MSTSPDRVGIRVNLTLPQDVIDILDRIGAVTGAGRATILREFVCEASPSFEDIAKALELATKRNLDAFKVLSDSLDRTTLESQQLSLDMKRTRRRMRRKPQ